MAEVYGYAERVCVWLGAKAWDDQTVFDRSDYERKCERYEVIEAAKLVEMPPSQSWLLNQFEDILKQYNEHMSEQTSFNLAHLSPTWKRVMEKVLKSVRDSRYKVGRGNWVWKADTAFNQIFWRSCWIVQEVVAAAKVTVRLGSFAIEWEDIPEARLLYEFLDAPSGNERARRLQDIRVTGAVGPHPFHLGWAAVETLQQLRKR
jgi:hypothetical protein